MPNDANVRFTFSNSRSSWIELGQIKLFGPTDLAITTGEEEIEAGKFSTETWYVFEPATGTEAEECLRATRATTPSGYYVDSWVMGVPKTECCREGNSLNQA